MPKSTTIPIKRLKLGVHHFDFQLDKDFFDSMNPDNEINASFKVSMNLEKKYGLYNIDFNINGHQITPCDRCLNTISIPIDKDYQLIIKIGEGEDDLDVVFIEEESDELDLGKYLYDYSILSLPIIKVIEHCEELENPPCNFKLLDKLYEEPLVDEKRNIWDELNNLNLDK